MASVSREDGPRGEHNPPGHGRPTRRAMVGCALLVALLALPRSFGGVFCSKKYRQQVSAHLENFHFCTKNNTTVVLLKTTSVRVSSIQIMQIRVQDKRKSIRKSRYVGDISTPPSLNICLSSSNSVHKLLRTLLFLFA